MKLSKKRKMLETIRSRDGMLETFGSYIRDAVTNDGTSDKEFATYIVTAFLDYESMHQSEGMFSAIVGWDLEDLLGSVFDAYGVELPQA